MSSETIEPQQFEDCPFCGSSLLTTEWIVPPWGAASPELLVVCNDCAASAPSYVWNSRFSNNKFESN